MTKRKTSRRDFLRGRSAADAMADRLEGLPVEQPGQASMASREETYLVRVGREAMACEFEILLNAGQYPRGTEIAIETLDRIDAFEEQLSFFRPASEISRLNRGAADDPVEVEPGLFGLLELAVRLHAETGGALDITAAALSDAWGFSRRQGKIPTEAELAEALANVGSDRLALDPEKQTIRFLAPGIRLNLGALGKGYALDCCATPMLDEGLRDFMIHGGQSSVLARGSTLRDPAGGWLVGVHHPLRHNQRLAEIRLRDRALATSGSEKQFFWHQGRRLSHILDPRTGWPAEGVLSATVLAPTAALAEGLSTAFFVMGVDQSREFCQGRPELAVVMVLPGRGSRVEVDAWGLEQGDLRILET